MITEKMHELVSRRQMMHTQSTDIAPEPVRTAGLSISLADVFALYVKTKNFHWHMSGPNFREYHLWAGRTRRSAFCYDRR